MCAQKWTSKGEIVFVSTTTGMLRFGDSARNDPHARRHPPCPNSIIVRLAQQTNSLRVLCDYRGYNSEATNPTTVATPLAIRPALSQKLLLFCASFNSLLSREIITLASAQACL
jgi:hypothetical protein